MNWMSNAKKRIKSSTHQQKSYQKIPKHKVEALEPLKSSLQRSHSQLRRVLDVSNPKLENQSKSSDISMLSRAVQQRTRAEKYVVDQREEPAELTSIVSPPRHSAFKRIPVRTHNIAQQQIHSENAINEENPTKDEHILNFFNDNEQINYDGTSSTAANTKQVALSELFDGTLE